MIPFISLTLQAAWSSWHHHTVTSGLLGNNSETKHPVLPYVVFASHLNAIAGYFSIHGVSKQCDVLGLWAGAPPWMSSGS